MERRRSRDDGWDVSATSVPSPRVASYGFANRAMTLRARFETDVLRSFVMLVVLDMFARP